MIVRADDQRRVPVPAQRRLALGVDGLDADAAAGLAVVAHHSPALRFRVHGVGIGRIDARNKSIAAGGDVPVRVHDAVHIARSRRAAPAEVILRAAVDVIKRRGVIDVDIVELKRRQVRFELPELAAVVGFVDAAVAADEDVIGVARIHPDGVRIDVLVAVAQHSNGASAIVGHAEIRIRGVEFFGILGIGDDLAVVHRRAFKCRTPLPRFAAVGRSVEGALIVRGLDLRVHQPRLRRRKRDADAAQIALPAIPRESVSRSPPASSDL